MEYHYVYAVTSIYMLLCSDYIVRVDAECASVPDVPHANPDSISSGPFSDGTVLKFTCNNGYRESGTSPSYTCSGSSWTGGNYRCSLIHCSRIDPPENGRITNSPDFAAGSSVSFSCNKGYERNGASTLTCRTDGQWRPLSPPTCDVKMCPDFGSVANANIFQEATDGVKNDYGSIVRVTCDRNYVLVGKNLVKCLETGQWEDKPTCEPVTCPPLAGATSSCIDVSHFYAPNMYILLCKDDSATVSVTKLGTSNGDTTCKNNKWSQPEPACYCDCLMNTSVSYVSMNNLVKSKFLKHGNTLDWSCSGGATKATSEAVVCTDGNLSAEPECTPPVTTTTRGPITTYGTDVSSETSTLPGTTRNEVSSRTISTSPATTTTTRPEPDNIKKIIGGILGGVAAVAIVWLLACKFCHERLGICPSMCGGCLRGSCCHNSQKSTIQDPERVPLSAKVVTIAAGETLTLECPRESPTGPVVWEGPPEHTVYTENDVVHPELPVEVKSRVATNRNHHNLEIQHVSLDDGGSYRCKIGGKDVETVDVKVKPAEPDIAKDNMKKEDPPADPKKEKPTTNVTIEDENSRTNVTIEDENRPDQTRQQGTSATKTVEADATEGEPAGRDNAHAEEPSATKTETADTTEGEPADTTTGEPPNTTAGEPANTPEGEPPDTTTGEPANTTAGEPANTAEGEPAGETGGHAEGPAGETSPLISKND